MEAPRRRKVPYWISYDFGTVDAGGSKTTTPAISVGPRPFVWTGISVVYGSSGSQDFDIEIRDEGASINFQKDAIPVNGIVRQNTKYADLPIPWRFEAFTSIVITVHNNSSTDAGEIEVILHGYLDE